MTPRSLATASLFVASLLLVGCGQVHSYQGVAGTQTPTARAEPVDTLSSTSSGGTCHGLSLDIAPGVTGVATPAKAIAIFLRSRTASFALPKTGWHGPASGGRFTSGGASMTVFRLPGAGFVVNEASDC
jgi:hypothetical protein